MKITRGEIFYLSNTIGKCAIKSLGPELFFPFIKLKSAATDNIEESHKLLKKIYEEVGVDTESNKVISHELGAELTAAEQKLNSDQVDFIETKLLNKEQFVLFSDENPKLTTSELEFLYKWLVGVK